MTRHSPMIVRISEDLPFKLGVLDQSPTAEGSSVGQALRNSVELAQVADGLGYRRFWLAEHHGAPGLAGASPEAVIGAVASATKQIRVGSGGIMLPHYSPLKVAETFSMLSSWFPDRIDLGVGRAAGTSPGVAFALQRDRRQRSPDDFHEQLQELLGYFEGSGRVGLTLPKFTAPAPFLLGSSMQSAVWAAELGLPYVFADFIHAGGAEAVEHYRRTFRPSRWMAAPHVIVAAWVICAETDAEALALSASARMMMVLMHQGKMIQVPPVERALHFLESNGLPPDFMVPGRRFVTGDAAQVKQALNRLSAEYEGVDEFLMANIIYDHGARLRSYELTAEAFSTPEVAWA